MRRRRVLVVWVVLAALLAVVAVLEYGEVRASRAARGAVADASALLPVPLEQLGAIEIVNTGTLHRFERDAAGAWFYHGTHTASEGEHTHTTDPAAAARIAEAFQAFGRTRVERRLPRGADPRAYGLTTPAILVLVYRAQERQPLAQYAVGDVAPDTVSRYVDVVGGAGVVTIPGYQIDNLLRLVAALGAGSSGR